MTEPLIGGVDNGSRAILTSSLFSGQVGVRKRGDALELAWFGRPPQFRAAVTGTLDGEPITITAIRSRELVPSGGMASSADRAIVATAVSVDQPRA